MKRIFFVPILLMFMFFFAQSSYACSCITVEPIEKDAQKFKESVRKYYLKEFNGAVFTGKVLNVEQVKIKIDEDYSIFERKVTIKVEKYWLGVKERIVTIYTGIGGGDCGVNFEKGKRYFFSPQYLEGRLQTGICDYLSSEEMEADGKSVKNFNEILGEAKTFNEEDN